MGSPLKGPRIWTPLLPRRGNFALEEASGQCCPGHSLLSPLSEPWAWPLPRTHTSPCKPPRRVRKLWAGFCNSNLVVSASNPDRGGKPIWKSEANPSRSLAGAPITQRRHWPLLILLSAMRRLHPVSTTFHPWPRVSKAHDWIGSSGHGLSEFPCSIIRYDQGGKRSLRYVSAWSVSLALQAPGMQVVWWMEPEDLGLGYFVLWWLPACLCLWVSGACWACYSHINIKGYYLPEKMSHFGFRFQKDIWNAKAAARSVKDREKPTFLLALALARAQREKGHLCCPSPHAHI